MEEMLSLSAFLYFLAPQAGLLTAPTHISAAGNFPHLILWLTWYGRQHVPEGKRLEENLWGWNKLSAYSPREFT